MSTYLLKDGAPQRGAPVIFEKNITFWNGYRSSRK